MSDNDASKDLSAVGRVPGWCFCPVPVPKPRDGSKREKAALLRAFMWPHDEQVDIAFLGGTKVLRGRVRAVAEEWLARVALPLTFVWRDGDAARVRIDFRAGAGCRSASACGSTSRATARTSFARASASSPSS